MNHRRIHQIIIPLLTGMMLWLSAAVGHVAETPLLTRPGADATTGPVTVRTGWSADAARPGSEPVLAVVLDVAPGYHVNADAGQLPTVKNFTPIPTRVAVSAEEASLQVQAPIYPPAVAGRVAFVEDELMFFEHRSVIFVPIAVSADAPAGTYPVTVRVSWQACDSAACLMPERRQVTERLTVGRDGPPPQALHPEWFAGYPADKTIGHDGTGPVFDVFGLDFSIRSMSVTGTLLLLAMAATGGFLLNLTPCVLPIIPIKIMGLAAAARHSPGRCLLLGIATAAGILAFWMAMGVTIALVAGFTATNQLYQYPAFPIIIGVVIAALAAGQFQAYHIRLPAFIYRLQADESRPAGALLMGVLAAVLSTPCTAPFMGAAAAWATTQQPGYVLMVFAAIGTGMALPYAVLSAYPGIVRRMPKSGPAGDLLKQVMGLLMLAAAVYFIGTGISGLVTRPPAPPFTAYWWAVTALVTAAGIWLVVRTVAISTSRAHRAGAVLMGLLLMAGGVVAGFEMTAPPPVDWVYYTPARLEAATRAEKTVVLVFTAEWCLNCKALDQAVLQDPEVVALLKKADITAMKVDLTAGNPEGKQQLAAVGSLSIPYLTVIAPDGRFVFKSDFYTARQLIAAIDEARAETRQPG